MRLTDLLIVHARVSAPQEPLVGSSDHRDGADTTQNGIIKGCKMRYCEGGAMGAVLAFPK